MRDVVLPGYEINGIIGKGGFGTVLSATRSSDGLAVAVKLVHRSNTDARERLLLEAEALEAIGPPHVPELYATGKLEGDSPFFVFEYLTLPTLDAQLAEWSSPLEQGRFLRLSHAILAALAETHRQSFVHRDLKPENIFISEDPPAAKLIDFGIAKAVGSNVASTAMGMTLGTPEYMSPEQCEGRADLDLRSDIYSVGVVLYEMLTTRPPFFGSASEVREAHVARRPPRPSRVADIPPVFDDVLLRCLSKDPSRRFTSAQGLKRALAWAAERHDRARPAPGDSRPSGRPEDARHRDYPSAGSRGSSSASARSSDSSKPPDAEPAVASRQRQYMALLFFEATTGTDRIKQALAALGGQLISVEGNRCAAIFGLGSSGNPVQRAFDSALALLGQRLCLRALVDYDRVRVRRRPDGTQRIFSTATTQRDRYPRDSDPPGVLFTTAAADMLVDLGTLDVRAGVVRLEPSDLDSNADATVFQLGSGPLIGREDSVERLVSSASEAFADEIPTMATVISEIGYGKSHLCATVLGHIRGLHPTVQVIQLRAREPLGGASYEVLRSLLRMALSLPGQVPLDRGREVLTSRLGPDLGEEVWPAAALALGWIATDAPEVRKLSAAPTALRSAATRAAGEALRMMCLDNRVCCVLDDAHYADETTLDALEYATRADTSAALWVCVLAAPSFEHARPSWGARAARADRIELAALSMESAATLCRRLLQPAETISQEAVDSLVEQTRGNPLLLVELTRGIKRHGLIRQHNRGDSWYLAHDELEKLPDMPKVEWLAERELATLPPGLAAHARLVAQLSAELATAEVEGVLVELERDGLGDAFPFDAQVGIHRLLHHGLLVTHRDGRFGFRHQLIRDCVAQSTPETVREHIHGAAFRYYRDTDAVASTQRLPRLAMHAAECGQRSTSSAIYLSLADRAASRHDYVDAELMYSRALPLLDDQDLHSQMRAYNGRGLMRYRSSRYEDALNDLDCAQKIARQLGDSRAEIELLLDKATVLDWMQDYRKSQSLVDDAVTLAGEVPTPLIAGRLSLGLGRAKWRSRELQEAQRLLEQAARQAEPLGDPGYETLVISLLLVGMVCTFRNQPDHAQRAFDSVMTLCEERGDKLHLASALNNRHFLWILRQDVTRAAADCLRCRQIGRDIGLSELDYICSYNLAELYYYAGDLDLAEPHLSRALEIEPSHSAKPLAMLLRARLQIFAGRWSEAKRAIDTIASSQASSRASEHLDALFIETDELLYDAIRLAIRPFDETEWHALRTRAETIAQPFETAEVIEMASLAALHYGDLDTAIRLAQDALAVCDAAPHLIAGRIERGLRDLERSLTITSH